MYNQIVCHLNKHDLLTPHQSGFRVCYSTQDVLLYVTDSWLRAIDESKYTGAVFLDLAKAFDPVDHTDSRRLPDLFCDYLTGRLQRVLFNGDQSQ